MVSSSNRLSETNTGDMSSSGRSSYTWSNINISGSSSVYLGNYYDDDSSQRLPMEQLLHIFNMYLDRQNPNGRMPDFLSGELHDTLIDHTQEFIRILEAQDQHEQAKGARNEVSNLISELEVLVAKLQRSRGPRWDKRRGPTTNTYSHITITGGSLVAGNRYSPAVPMYTSQLRKALREYFRAQGRVDLLEETGEVTVELPMRIAAGNEEDVTEAEVGGKDDSTKTTALAKREDVVASSEQGEGNDWIVVDEGS